MHDNRPETSALEDTTRTISSPCSLGSITPRRSCLVCYEYEDTEDGISDLHIIQLTECQHTFCQDCLQRYGRLCVQERRSSLVCPVVACQTRLDASLILNTDDYRRYECLQMDHDPSLRKYDSCDDYERIDEDDEESPRTCQTCESSQPSELSLPPSAKPCSHCGIGVEKIGGCDHIVCTHCYQDFCYACGTHQYLEGSVIRHCTQCRQAYIDHRHQRQYQRRVLLSTVVLLPLYMVLTGVYLCIVIVVFVGTLGFWGCFRCGKYDVLRTNKANLGVAQSCQTRRAVVDTATICCLPMVALLREAGVPLGSRIEEILCGLTTDDLDDTEVDIELGEA